MNTLSGRFISGLNILAGTLHCAAQLTIDNPGINLQNGLAGFEITFFDHNDVKTKVWTSDQQNHPVISLEFEIVESGCGKLSLTIAKNAGQDLFYNQRVDIALFGDSQPWYSGYLQVLPQPGGTEDKDTFQGYGYFDLLETVLVNRTYADQDIGAIVQDILREDVDLKTGISYQPGKIYSVDYTAQGLKFEYRTAKDCFKTLAEFATDYVYGVDEYRDFYFRPRNHAINERTRFYVGHHLHKFEPEEDTSEIINFFYVKYGRLQNGSNLFATPFFDNASMQRYGRREKVLSVPEAVADADVIRWAGAELDKVKNPKRSAKLGSFPTEIARRKIYPDGMARVISADGTQVFDYPIKSVKYRLDAKGLQFSMELGDLSPKIDQYLTRMYRDMKNAEYLQQLNNSREK